MKKIIILIIVIIFITVIDSPAFAAESSPSANTKTKLQSLQAEIASRASKIKQEIGRRLQNRVYTGFIKSKSANSLTIATSQGSKIININEYTVYQAQKPTSLSVDDYILALGDIDDTAVLTAKKIIKTASPSAVRQVIFGTVTNTDNGTVTIQNKQGQNFSLATGEETVFKMGKSEGNIDDIKINKPVIAVGENTSTKTLKARFIYIPEKPATTSGKKKV